MEETIQFYSMMTSARLTLGHMWVCVCVWYVSVCGGGGGVSGELTWFMYLCILMFLLYIDVVCGYVVYCVAQVHDQSHVCHMTGKWEDNWLCVHGGLQPKVRTTVGSCERCNVHRYTHTDTSVELWVVQVKFIQGIYDSSSIKTEIYSDGNTLRLLKLLFFIYECAGI